MQIESLPSLLKSKTLAPVLFLFGEEEFLMDEAYTMVYNALGKRGITEFNIDVVDGEDTSAEQIVHMASAFPMMGDLRVLVVKHFDKAVGGRRSKAAEKSPLATYLRNPSPQTVLILMTSAGSTVNEELKGLSSASGSSKQSDKAQSKIKKLKFPYNILIDKADWIEFPKMYDRMVVTWMTKRVSSNNREISPEAAEFILARCGNSLRDISNELEKIITFVGDKKKIGLDDILHLVGDSREFNIFELQKAVGERALSKSLNILQHMMRADRNEVMIVSMLTRYFISLWKLVDASRSTTNSFELAKLCGLSSFFIPEYLAVLNRYTVAQIEKAFFALREADRRIKSSSEDTLILLQQLLMHIMQDAQAA